MMSTDLAKVFITRGPGSGKSTFTVILVIILLSKGAAHLTHSGSISLEDHEEACDAFQTVKFICLRGALDNIYKTNSPEIIKCKVKIISIYLPRYGFIGYAYLPLLPNQATNRATRMVGPIS